MPGPLGQRSAARAWIVRLAMASAAVILSIQLFLPPVVGLANNGDFEKVMGYAGFQYRGEPASERYYSWIVTKFAVVQLGWYRSGYLSSETLLATAARVAHLASRKRLFDIRELGLVHVILLLVAIGALVFRTGASSVWAQMLVAALLVFFFTDVGYAASFNSFYGQSASLLFLLLAAAMAAGLIRRPGQDGPLLAAYFLAAALFVASKPQESLQGPLLAIFGLRLGRVPGRSWWRTPAVWMSLGLCAFSFWYNRQTPPEYRRLAKYNAVFAELLIHSPDPRRDLEDLGLDPAWVAYADRGGNRPPPAIWNGEFRRFRYRTLLRFYVTHPARLSALLRRASVSAFRLRPLSLGNFAKSEGLPPRSKAIGFSSWSDFRLHFSEHALLALAIVLGAGLVSAVLGYPRAALPGRLAREGIALLVLMGTCEFLVCVLADSLQGLPRHLYLFQALFDLVLIAVAARFAQWLAAQRGQS